MPVNYRQRAALLLKAGFTSDEAGEFAKQYSVAQMRSLPYLVRMRRWRYLYSVNLASKGYGADEIERSIRMLYTKKGWLTADGQPDAWEMLKAFRKQIIQSGGDPSPGFAPRRSHHSRAEITQAELNAQARQLRIQREIEKEVGWR
jgi:hypothetical protein